jgi:Zn-dependent peptidase ImmA (M78 family)/transcriptional regulator with XRE-family HTH domain
MNKVNPEMIVLARELKGVTQSELAIAVSLTQATISRYESELIEVPEEHLRVLSHFLERPPSFFFWHERLYGASCMYHRKNRRLAVSELRMIHAKVNLLRIQATRLIRQAKVKSNYSFHRLDPAVYGGPEGCATRLRQLWQMPPGPVRHVPRMIESAGGLVFRCPFGLTRVDGISQWPLDDPQAPPVFFVHQDISGDRARLTLCHEIGHVVMHHTLTGEDVEAEANRFAAEFLMPAEEIGPELHDMTLPKAAALKGYWKTSMQSIIVRSHQLDKISDNQYQYLFRQLSAKGYRTCEPVPIPPEEPTLFRDLLEFHRKSLGRDLEDLAQFLGELEHNFALYYGHNFSNFRLVV